LLQSNFEKIQVLKRKLDDPAYQEKLFKSKFNKKMAQTSVFTLENIYYIIDEYLISYKVERKKQEQLLLLFGLLQGIFAGIDALYSLGRSLGLNKILIGLNQNKVLKEIKRIRNDVVGHTTYRYYDNNTIGFCILDFEKMTESTIFYSIYTDDSDDVERKTVDMIEVINSYLKESITNLQSTSRFLDLKLKIDTVNLLDLAIALFNNYSNEVKDKISLGKIKENYQKLMEIDNENDRILWRISNIEYMFSLEENDYVKNLIFLEIKKLYESLYELERQVNSQARKQSLVFDGNPELNRLKRDLRKHKDKNYNLYNDYTHPLYLKFLKSLIKKLKKEKKYYNLSLWLEKIVSENDQVLLYAFGSYLKYN